MNNVYDLMERGRQIRAKRQAHDAFESTGKLSHPASMGDNELAGFCALSVEEQHARGRRKRFEDELAVRALDASERGVTQDKVVREVNFHRNGFSQHELRRNHKNEDPPCKDWEKNMGEVNQILLKTLRSIWQLNVVEWAKKYPYLASPTAPCECRKCGGPGIVKAHDQWGFDQPMRGPSD